MHRIPDADNFFSELPAQHLNVNRPAACPAPAIQASCVKRFNLQGYWPDGNVFDCTAAKNIATNIEASLNKLGGTPLNTPIKQRLNTIRSNVFVFDNQNVYDSTFTTAGVWSADAAPVFQGFTYTPSVGANTWYTILNLAGVNGTLGNAEYVATHEIGHALDDTFSTQSSATAAFDLAMQHDWLNLDYTS